MPNDSVIPASGATPVQPGAGTATPPAPVSGTPPAEAPVSRADFARFGEAVAASMAGLSQQVARAVAPAAPVAPPVPPPTERGQQFFTRAAQGDFSDIDRLVDERLQQNGIAGFLGQRAQAEAAQNERTTRERIDAEFGTGTYDAELKAIVEQNLGESVAARSLPQAWDNAVAMAKGTKFATLAEKRAAEQKRVSDAAAAAEAARMNAPWMPGGNGFAPGPTGQLDESDKALMSKVSGKTGGHVPSHGDAAKIRDLMYRKGADGVTMEEIAALGIAAA